jgi:hypothetical protein
MLTMEAAVRLAATKASKDATYKATDVKDMS